MRIQKHGFRRGPPEELAMMLDRSYALRGRDADGVPTRLGAGCAAR
jgi:hypothetical protein